MPLSLVILNSKDKSAGALDRNRGAVESSTLTTIVEMEVLEVSLVVGDASRSLVVNAYRETI